MFSKVLIANRGEIAVRVARTCRDLGITSVAVHSDADATALHVLVADEAVPIGPSDPRSSYLSAERIVSAALESGAEAVHPGYGFLSEDAFLARACADAGLVFVGPPANVIDILGRKTEARALATECDVPVVPGAYAPAAASASRAAGEPDASNESAGSLSSPAGPASTARALHAAAEELGYPVLVKASAGGGGKGMRRVDDAADLTAACAGARREAEAAFGDGTIYLERALLSPRHVEVQILCDAHGARIHLGERECSIQRRHQKLVEESPSPGTDPELRAALTAAALRIAERVGYVNAGTVEFLVAEDGAFYFLEVNTRIQVEHPVTELVTGIDLVRAQLEVAAGEPLRWSQDDIRPRGHAIECRIYAEDPGAGFAPSPGPVLFLGEPSGPGVRVDSGIRAGGEVPVHYDPILSKVVAFGVDRGEARARMQRALADTVVLGVRTTAPFLRDLVAHERFAAGATTTDFIGAHLRDWAPPDDALRRALLAVAVDARLPSGAQTASAGGVPAAGAPGAAGTGDTTTLPAPASPWQTLGPWRAP